MTNFTKGEWHVQKLMDNNISIESDTGMSLAIISNDFESDIANTHLIKTSPKMYNLLHKIMVEHCNDSVLYNEIDELLEEARGE